MRTPLEILIAAMLLALQIVLADPAQGVVENAGKRVLPQAMRAVEEFRDMQVKQDGLAEIARLQVRLGDPVGALEIARRLPERGRDEIVRDCLILESRTGDIRKVLAEVDALREDEYRRPAYVEIAKVSFQRDQTKTFMVHLAQVEDLYIQVAARSAIAKAQAASGRTTEAMDTLASAIAAGGSKLWYLPGDWRDIALTYAKMRAYDAALAFLGKPDPRYLERREALADVAWAAVWNSDVSLALSIADSIGPCKERDRIKSYVVTWLLNSGKTFEAKELATSIVDDYIRDQARVNIAQKYSAGNHAREAMTMVGQISDPGIAIIACGRCAAATQTVANPLEATRPPIWNVRRRSYAQHRPPAVQVRLSASPNVLRWWETWIAPLRPRVEFRKPGHEPTHSVRPLMKICNEKARAGLSCGSPRCEIGNPRNDCRPAWEF